MAGVTPAGFVKKTQEEIIDDVSADLRGPDGIAADIDLSPDQPLGQIIGTLAKPVAEAWEVAQVVTNALNPNNAEGVLLENVCSITGTVKAGATFGLVVQTLNLQASKSVPAGSIVAVAGQTANRWILVGPPDGNGIAVPGPVVSTSAGNYTGIFRSETTGPNVANAGTITTIVTPVTGWLSTTNALAATPGQVVESDTHLRQKRRAEIAAAGSSTLGAIRAELLQLPGMIQVDVFENTARTGFDSAGRPAGAVEAIVYDGASPTVANADIAEVLWNNKPAGTWLYGFDIGFYTDSSGGGHNVYFTRASISNVSIDITLVTTPDFPADGVARVKAALVAKGTETARVAATSYPLTEQAYAISQVPGIANITAFLWGRTATVGATLTTALVAGAREIFRFDSANIVVNVT